MVEVGAAEGAGRGRSDPCQGGVPAGAVVHTLFPGVHDGRERPPAQIPAVQQIAVPGGQPGIHPGEETAGPRQSGVGAVDQPDGQRVHRWLHDAGGLYGARGARGAPRGRGAPEVGAREVGVERDGGVEDDVRDASVTPLGAQQRLQLGLRPQRGEVAQPYRDERGVPGPLVRVQPAGGHRGGAGPVVLQHTRGPDVQRSGRWGRIRRVGRGGGINCSGRVVYKGGRGGAGGELGGAIHSGLPERRPAERFGRGYRRVTSI